MSGKRTSVKQITSEFDNARICSAPIQVYIFRGIYIQLPKNYDHALVWLSSATTISSGQHGNISLLRSRVVMLHLATNNTAEIVSQFTQIYHFEEE
jgi:hypothetical protein